jgi:hypothetical protein
MCQRIGFPPISIIGFGLRWVSSLSREPTPPVSMTAFTTHLASAGIETLLSYQKARTMGTKMCTCRSNETDQTRDLTLSLDSEIHSLLPCLLLVPAQKPANREGRAYVVDARAACSSLVEPPDGGRGSGRS